MMTKDFLCPFKDSGTCKDIPLVDYKKAWHEGGTGYIDGIQPSDDIFSSGPLAKFIDNVGRSAIAIKYNVSCPDDTKAVALKSGEYSVAAFQRYSDSEQPWVYGGHYMHAYAMHTSDNTVEFEWLESLIHNKYEEFNLNDYVAYKDDNIECSITIEDSSVAVEHQPSNDTYHAEL